MKKIILNAKLVTPLVHTEEVNSNIANIYRQKMYHEGAIYEVPAIHGNSIRGLFRNIGAEQFLSLLDVRPNSVPTNLFHTLFAGGVLEKMDIFVDVEAKKKFRACVPFLSVFGSAVGNEMLEGKLIVNSVVPKCKELGTGPTSVYDLTQIIRYTRQDDRKAYYGEKQLADEATETHQMFYDTEALIAGVDLDFEFVLKDVTEVEEGMFEYILQEFKKAPYIGGKSSAGHGLIAFDYAEEQPMINFYKNYIADQKDEIKKYLQERFGDARPAKKSVVGEPLKTWETELEDTTVKDDNQTSI